MKKIVCAFFAIAVIVSLCACGNIGKPKLDAEQQAMLDTVMSNLDVWETSEAKNAVYIQLQDISGDYSICVGYDDATTIEQDEALYTFSYDFCESYNISNVSINQLESGSMIMPGEQYMWGGIGTGRKIVGSSFWNVTDTYESKYENMKALFLNLVEE